MKKEISDNMDEYNQINDEINLQKIFNLILRNKKFISLTTFLLFIISIFFSFFNKKIWEGNFQIVLNLNDELPSINSKISAIAGSVGLDLNSSKTSLSTEVGILESPSLLLPIYEFVKNKKDKVNPKQNYKNFRSWKRDNLNIQLKAGTSILNISYKDEDKDLIIPLLNNMTNVYQDYSGKNKRRGIELTKIYLNKQINDYQLKSISSFKAAQDYAADQDLTILDIGVGNNNSNISSQNDIFRGIKNMENISINSSNEQTLANNTSIEVARVTAANQIRKNDSLIKKILEIDTKGNNFQYITYLVPELSGDTISENLTKLDTEIAELKSKYKDTFPPLKAKISTRDFLRSKLKDAAIAILNTKKIEAESIIESATRPKGVVIKYKELIRMATRDELTLIQLENMLRSLQLEESKIEDPWELITKPTLKEKPVSAGKSTFAFFGILIGLSLGLILSYIKENKKGIIYEDKDLESLLNAKILDKINLQKLDLSTSKSELLIEDFLNLKLGKKIQLLPSKKIKDLELNKIKKFFDTKGKNIEFLDDINNVQENKNLVLLANSKSLTYLEVNALKNKLDLIDSKIYGILMIDE